MQPKKAEPGHHRGCDAPRSTAGAFPIKRIVGDTVVVEADVVRRRPRRASRACCSTARRATAEWTEVPMEPLVNDRWRGSFTVQELGRYRYTVMGLGRSLQDLVARPGASASRPGRMCRSTC